MLQKLIAKMEKYVWLMELTFQEEWKFVSVVYGEQCVIIFGVLIMPELSAENLDLWMIVRASCKKIIVIMIHFYVVARAFSRARFGQGEGPILLDGLQCTGEEESLLDCRHRGIGIHSCGHYEDASVLCYNGECIIYKNKIILILFQTLVVRMEKYVWLMELALQEEWKFVSVVYGEQCVMILGIIEMLELSAGNWDSWVNVSIVKTIITL